MTRSRWVLPALVMITLTVAGCGGGQPADGPSANAAPAPLPAAPMSGPVTNVEASCGVHSVYWQGTWWRFELPIQPVRNQATTTFVAGTMTTTGNNEARFDSPDLVAPQTLSRTPSENPQSPPFDACTPTPSAG